MQRTTRVILLLCLVSLLLLTLKLRADTPPIATSVHPSAPLSQVASVLSSHPDSFLQDRGVHLVPQLPRPPLRQAITDPTFGATIIRLTDPSMTETDPTYPALGLRHEYARYPAMNADATKVIVQVLGGAHRGFFEVRDVTTGALLHRIPAAGEPEGSWHPSDPQRFFYRSGNEARVFHVDTGVSETLMSFPQYYGISTREEGRPSDDWRYYAFIGYHDSSFATVDLVVADLIHKRILATLPHSGIPDWISMSPSGAYVVAMWVTGEGTRIYDRDTLSALRMAFSDYSHADFAVDAEGNDVLVYQANESKQLRELGDPPGAPFVMSRLSDGKKTMLMSVPWEWSFSSHFSGLASRAHPGWVLVSTYTQPQIPQHPFSREIFWLKLDGSGAVRRIVHHHSDQASRTEPNGEQSKDYFAEPQATSSWDGNTVLFSSVWGEPFARYDLYAVTGQWW